MKRTIIAYHQDDAGDWVAHLSCGHQRHVRHDPPWMTRTWVTTEHGREERRGQYIECGTCAQEAHDSPN